MDKIDYKKELKELYKPQAKKVVEVEVPAIDKVRFESFTEGRCAQILYIGPFSEEGPTVERVHSFIEEQGSELSGKHHEIYLSDIRRAAPDNWKTVIRQPMKQAGNKQINRIKGNLQSNKLTA